MKRLSDAVSIPLIGLIVLALLAAACTPATPPTAPQPAAPQATAAAAQPVAQPTQAAVPVSGSQTVTVIETEFKLDMPSSVQAGMVTFNVINKGTIPHSLEVQGQGIDQKLPSTLQPGQSGKMQVNLKPGTYMVICPVDDHSGVGMMMNLTVQ